MYNGTQTKGHPYIAASLRGERVSMRTGRFVIGLLYACSVQALHLSPPGIAQSPQISAPELTALLTRMQANVTANKGLVAQYVSDMARHAVVYKGSKVVSEFSDKLESVLIDGKWYQRTIERNGKPLRAKVQAANQTRLDDMADRTKGMDFIFELVQKNPSDYIYSALPVCCLSTLFENRLLRHERISGRDCFVVESHPLPQHSPVSEEEKSALDWKETTWIDTDDLMPVRYEVELVNDKRYLLRGSTTTAEFMRTNGSTAIGGPHQIVWMQRYFTGRLLWEGHSETSEGTSSNFRRFRSNMRVLHDSVREVPAQPDKF